MREISKDFHGIGYGGTSTGVPKKAQTVAMPQSYSSSWKEPYLAVLKEADKEKLTGLLYATELAMFLRAQQLAQCADGHKELIEIAIASENLLALKTVILSWPPRLAMWYPTPATSYPFTRIIEHDTERQPSPSNYLSLPNRKPRSRAEVGRGEKEKEDAGKETREGP